MCLAIPGAIVELTDPVRQLATVDVGGVRRTVSVALLDGAAPGDWVLIHVGFALSKIDEPEARATLALLQQLGGQCDEGLAELRGSAID